MNKVVYRGPNYKIEWSYISGEKRFFLDRTNWHNICNGSYDLCLKELDRYREIDELERKMKEKLVQIWRT